MIEISQFEDALPVLSETPAPPASASPATQEPAHRDSPKVATARAWLYAERFDPAVEGERDNAVYGNANRLREKFGISEAEARDILLEYNRQKCSPPLDDDEVRQAVRNAYKYGKKPTGTGYEPTKTRLHPETWPELIPLAEYDLPTFPAETLPESLRDYVKDVAGSIQVPLDLPGMLSLAAVSVAAGGRYRVQGKPDWTEQVNLYLAVVMVSATRKSKCFQEMTKPIQVYERELCESLRSQIEKCQSDYRVLEAKRKKLERDLAVGQGDRTALDEVNEEMANFQWVHEPTLIASDVTVEVVSRLLSQNNGRLGILSAEGGIFAIFAGRYSDNKPVNDVFLKGHAGDMIKVHRVGRESEHIEQPALTMGICIQPTILENLGHKRLLQDSGLLARFLFAIPETSLGSGTFETPAISEDHRKTYCRIIRHILESAEEAENMQTIRLSGEAVTRFRQFYEDIERRLAESGDLYSILPWGGKLRGAVLRIAGLLELVKNAENRLGSNFAPEISLQTIESAIEIGRYFIPHAKCAIGLDDIETITVQGGLLRYAMRRKGLKLH